MRSQDDSAILSPRPRSADLPLVGSNRKRYDAKSWHNSSVKALKRYTIGRGMLAFTRHRLAKSVDRSMT
jgi:hypothetical protein